MRFNTRTQLSGHVWQGRFYSCPVDESHQWAAGRYVERNPVRAGLVDRAEDFPWSSAPAHCGLRQDAVLSNEFPPPGVVPQWAEWLRSEEDADVQRLRTCTRVGRPCGHASFVARLESLLERVLTPKRRGRKPKTVEKEIKS